MIFFYEDTQDVVRLGKTVSPLQDEPYRAVPVCPHTEQRLAKVGAHGMPRDAATSLHGVPNRPSVPSKIRAGYQKQCFPHASGCNSKCMILPIRSHLMQQISAGNQRKTLQVSTDGATSDRGFPQLPKV